MYRFLWALIFLITISAESFAAPMVYRYWDLAASPTRDEYQFELLRLALEKTRETHGDYELIRVTQKLTSLRASREVSRGELINIEATPNWTTDSVPSELRRDKRIAVEIPLLQGLLGYRRLIIRKADLEKFSKITRAEQLQELVAGQGRDWEDVFIYRHNGYRVNSDADYYNLFAMLVAGRFDYLPLGTIEAESFIHQFGKFSDEVVIAPNILIYYPFPVIFQVSIKQPEYAKRVELGLSAAKQDGSMEELFEHYFAEDLKKLRAPDMHVFVLKNERVPDELRLDDPVLIKQ